MGHPLLFLPLGLFVGTVGTLIGAGGGFLLVPFLLFISPERSPAEITAISLFAVSCNAMSGTIAYWHKRQIHWRSAIIFTLVSIPGALLGSLLIRWVDPKHFQLLFAGLLFTMGCYLLFKRRTLKPHDAKIHSLTRKQYALGITISVFVSLVAAFLGIGGGIIHVPLMTEALQFPVHIATGTSHAILSATSLVATIHHYLSGDLPIHETFMIYLAVGLVIGAQIGARLSKRVEGHLILRTLGLALLFVSIRLVWKSVSF